MEISDRSAIDENILEECTIGCCTCIVNLIGVLVAILCSIPLGIIAAVHQNSWKDSASMVAALIGVSMPSFWLGLLLMLLFVFAGNLLGFSLGMGTLLVKDTTLYSTSLINLRSDYGSTWQGDLVIKGLNLKYYSRNSFLYDGVFCFKRYLSDSAGEGLSMINLVRMQEYVEGVIPNEISNTWPIECLRAFALMVRSFAIANINRHYSAYGFDVCSSSCCQVYQGRKQVNDTVVEAVRSTRNEILVCGDTIVESAYSSSQGGYTVGRLTPLPRQSANPLGGLRRRQKRTLDGGDHRKGACHRFQKCGIFRNKGQQDR